MISAQIDADLALIHLDFIGSQLIVRGYHSPHKNIAYFTLNKRSCPRVLHNESGARNAVILHVNDYCQFVKFIQC